MEFAFVLRKNCILISKNMLLASIILFTKINIKISYFKKKIRRDNCTNVRGEKEKGRNWQKLLISNGNYNINNALLNLTRLPTIFYLVRIHTHASHAILQKDCAWILQVGLNLSSLKLSQIKNIFLLAEDIPKTITQRKNYLYPLRIFIQSQMSHFVRSILGAFRSWSYTRDVPRIQYSILQLRPATLGKGSSGTGLSSWKVQTRRRSRMSHCRSRLPYVTIARKARIWLILPELPWISVYSIGLRAIINVT